MKEFSARLVAGAVVFVMLGAAMIAAAWIVGVAWRVFRAAAGIDA